MGNLPALSVQQKETDVFQEMLKRSYIGDYFASIGSPNVRTIIPNVGTQIGNNSGITIDPLCTFQLDSIVLESDRPVYVQCRISQIFGSNEEGTSGSTVVILRKVGFNNMIFTAGKLQQQVTIPMGGSIISELGSVTLSILSLDPNQEAPFVSWRLVGKGYCGTLNFNAPNRILLISDSIGHSNMGNESTNRPYTGRFLYVKQVADKIKQATQKDVHVDIQSFGGSTSRNIVDAMNSFKFDDFNAGLWIIQVGTNDALNNQVGTTNLKNNIIEVIKRRNTYSPDTSIVIVNIFPTDSTARINFVTAYRTALQEVANDATYGGVANKVYFSDTSDIFTLNPTPSADVNFKDIERIAGQRLHLSGLGHTLAANKIFETVQTTEFYANLK